jgi:hypothetical protein
VLRRLSRFAATFAFVLRSGGFLTKGKVSQESGSVRPAGINGSCWLGFGPRPD